MKIITLGKIHEYLVRRGFKISRSTLVRRAREYSIGEKTTPRGGDKMRGWRVYTFQEAQDLIDRIAEENNHDPVEFYL